MNRELRDIPLPPPDSPEDPFRLGWRYVRRQRPDGTVEVDQVPLTSEDVLYPEEDDFVLQKPPHLRDFEYCHGTLETYYADRPDVVVLGDCRVDWGVEGVRPLGPDVLVLFGVREWREQGTFRVAEEGGRPILVIEVTSPSTHEHDVGRKIDLYYRAGVQLYVLINRGPDGEDPAVLEGYRRGPEGWLPLSPDEQGRLDLDPVSLTLGLTDDHPWFYDRGTGERLLNRTELRAACLAARAEAQEAQDQARKAREQAKKARDQVREAQAEAREAEALLEQERQARAALEQRLRELEERLRGQGPSS